MIKINPPKQGIKQIMSKTCLMAHIVFATKNRRSAIPLVNREELCDYIGGILKNLKCFGLSINGMTDHLHLLVKYRASLAIADLVREIKTSTTHWMKKTGRFEDFYGWQEGYFAGSVGPDGVERCKRYIENQEHHHNGNAFMAEIEWMIQKYGLDWYESEWNE